MFISSVNVKKSSQKKLSVNCRPTDDQQVTDSLPTAIFRAKSVGRLSAVKRPTVGRQTTNSRPTVDRQSADSRPTGILGSSSSQLPEKDLKSFWLFLHPFSSNHLYIISLFVRVALTSVCFNWQRKLTVRGQVQFKIKQIGGPDSFEWFSTKEEWL